MKIDLRLSEKDRERFGGPEWVTLDLDRVDDTDARTLIRWEAECNAPLDGAMDSIGPVMKSGDKLILLWLARKQNGDLSGGQLEDGTPEPFSRLLDVKARLIEMRRTPGDASPPVPAEADEQSGDGSAS